MVDRAYGPKPNVNILNRIVSFDVAYGTPYCEYMPTYHPNVTDLMMGGPTYLPLVGAVVGAVRDNLHRYSFTLGFQLFTEATSNN